MQDENLDGWKSWNGKAIQHSILGRVKAKLIDHPKVVVLDRFVPTTKLCICGNKKDDLKLSDRVYNCDVCGYLEDRDIHAAKNMVRLGKIALEASNIKLRRGPTNTPVEQDTSALQVSGVEAGRLHPLGCN
jgi:putative transposase